MGTVLRYTLLTPEKELFHAKKRHSSDTVNKVKVIFCFQVAFWCYVLIYKVILQICMIAL